MRNVKCGKNTPKFFSRRLRPLGRKLGKCIRFNEKWVTPSEFESMSAIQARKWKQSIKLNGKPVGEWLPVNEESISALARQEDIGSPYTDKSDSLESVSQNNEHDNAGSQDTSLQQHNCINTTCCQG